MISLYRYSKTRFAIIGEGMNMWGKNMLFMYTSTNYDQSNYIVDLASNIKPPLFSSFAESTNTTELYHDPQKAIDIRHSHHSCLEADIVQSEMLLWYTGSNTIAVNPVMIIHRHHCVVVPRGAQ